MAQAVRLLLRHDWCGAVRGLSYLAMMMHITQVYVYVNARYAHV